MDLQPPQEFASAGVPPPPDVFPHEPGAEATRPTRSRARVLAVLVSALVVLGGGAAAALFALRGSSEQLLKLIPASSDLVVTAYLDPSAGQKMNLLELAHKFPALRSDQNLTQRVNDALDQGLSGLGLTHEDVTPWLGSQIAVAVDFHLGSGSTSAAVLIASKDDEAAEASLLKAEQVAAGGAQTRDYRGVTMHIDAEGAFAIVDHTVVIAEEAGQLESVIDVSKGTTPNLADDSRFQDVTSALPEGKLGLLYVNPADPVKEVLSTPGVGAVANTPGFDIVKGVRGAAMSVSAQPDGLALDLTVQFDPAKLDPATRQQLDQPVHTNAMLSFVPANAYVVATQENVGTSLKQAVDQALSLPGTAQSIRESLGLDDALASLSGDVGVEVSRGTAAAPIGGAILFGVRDPGPVQNALNRIADLVLAADRGGSKVTTVTGSGLSNKELRQPGLSSGRLGPSAWKSATYQGTTIRYLDDPSLAEGGFLPAYAVVGGAAIIGSGPDEIRKLIDVKSGQPSITSSASYSAALSRVPKGGSSFFLDVAGLVAPFAGALSALPPGVGENIEPIKTVVAGGTSSSSRVSSRLFVTIGE